MAIDLRSMDKRKLISLGLAVACGLFAVVLTKAYIDESSARKGRMMAEDLTGEKIKQFITRIDSVERKGQEQLAALQQAIAQGQMNIGGQRSAQPTPQRESLALKTPSGKRAITVIVDKIFALGGMVSPGDKVDVISHLSVPASQSGLKSNEIVSLTLFQNVLILAVGDNIQASALPQGTAALPSAIPITFAMDPQEANLIAFAQQHGNLQLLLRSPQDSQAYILPASSWENLSEYIKTTQGIDAGLVRKPVDEEQEAPIEIIRGGR